MEAVAARPKKVEEEQSPFNLPLLLDNLEQAEYQWQEQGLPIALNAKRVRDLIRTNDTVILEADTGSGKSTIAPALSLHELLLDNPDAKILVTQPRRLATESISEFVGEKIGEEFVDYQYKGHRITKPNSRIQFTVEQSLLNSLVTDETLSDYDMVMIDEVHERSISIDILLPLLKRAQKLRKQQHKRPLKVVLASGTMDATLLSKYFGEAHQEHIEGRAYKVDPFFSDTEIPLQDIPRAAAKKAKELVIDEKEKGDILIFMPGKWEIDTTREEIQKVITDPNIEIVTIMGGDQDGDPYKKINNNPGNKQRIYIATDAAETSITIPKITAVIDSGLMRKMVYDAGTQVTTLETLPHTVANWLQRIGRAGRVMEGKAYALFTKKELEKRDKNQKAEFLRTDLTPQILKMKAIGIRDVHKFDYIEHPGNDRINQAIRSLQLLGALDKDGNITPLGKEMATIDEDPRYSRLLIEARNRDCLAEASLLLGFIKNKSSIFKFNRKRENFQSKYADFIDPNSDFITILNVWNDYIDSKESGRVTEWEQKGFNQASLRGSLREQKELVRDSFFKDKEIRLSKFNLSNEKKEAINTSIAAAFMPNLLVQEKDKTYKFQTGSSSHIQLDAESGVGRTSPSEIICGKMWSIKKFHKETMAIMNMLYDEKKLFLTFNYLSDIVHLQNIEQPTQEALSTLDSTKETSKTAEMLPTIPTASTLPSSKEFQALHDKVNAKARPDSENNKTVMQKLASKVKNIWLSFWKKVFSGI